MSDVTNRETVETVNQILAELQQAARDGQFIENGYYATEADGRAAVADGETFKVQGSGDVAAYQYRRISADVSLLLASFPASSAVDALSAVIDMRTSTVDRRAGVPVSDRVIQSIVDNSPEQKRLASWTQEGSTLINELSFYSTPSDRWSRRSGVTTRPLIGDRAGAGLFVYDRKGRFDFVPSPAFVKRMADALSVTPPEWRGDAAASDVRRSESLTRAIVDDSVALPAWRGEVVQPNSSDDLSALAVAQQILLGVHYVGQSNGFGSGAAVTDFPSPMFGYHVYRFTRNRGDTGASIIPASSLQAIQPLADYPLDPPGPYTYFAYAAAWRARLLGYQAPAMLCRFDAQGSVPLANLLKGQNLYTNLMTSIACAAKQAVEFGLQYQPYINFTQGEGNGEPTDENISNYRANFSSLLENYATDCLTQSGRMPVILINQTNGPSVATGSLGAAPVAHLLETRARRGTAVVLAGPMYQQCMGDILHGNSAGRMVRSDLENAVYQEVRRLGAFFPLDIECDADGVVTGIQRDGAVITLTLNRQLHVDTDWVPESDHLGFAYSDDSGSVSILSVAVANKRITITLSAVPTGANKTLLYAMTPSSTLHDSGANQWSAYRGQIYADSGYASVWNALGYDVPKTVRHYLVRLKENIA